MPLGKLSKTQIAKGFDVLEEIEAAMKQRRGKSRLEELSSKFFTTIPHNFGRNIPPTIDSKEVVEQKKEMLMVSLLRSGRATANADVLLTPAQVLADIELAQTLKSETEKAQGEIETVPHPLDQDYSSLKCQLSLLDTKTETFKVGSNAQLTWTPPPPAPVKNLTAVS